MIFLLNEAGRHLGSRPVAAQIRQKIMAFDHVVLDFAGVEVISHSFADELVGKLAGIYGKDLFKSKIKLKNVPEESRAIFTYVINDNINTQIYA